jgi:hypothetical protein
MADNDADSDEGRELRPLQAAACTRRGAFGPRAGQKVLTFRPLATATQELPRAAALGPADPG